MQLPQVFNYEGAQVRTVVIDGELFFFAQDVAKILGYSATSALLKRLDADEQRVYTFLDGTTYKKQTVINESGLFNGVMGSQLESSKRFKKWVTAEVLPAIRKTGGYNPNLPAIPQTFAEALRLAANQAEQISLMAPKADFFDAVTDSKTAVDMAIVAKTLNVGIGRNSMFELLRDAGILDKRNIPYQKYCDAGYFRVVESQYNKPDGTACVSFKTVVFQKGMDYIRRLLTKREAA